MYNGFQIIACGYEMYQLPLALVLLCQGLGLGGGVGWEPGALAGATLIMNAKGRAGALSSSTPARSPLPSESSRRESRSVGGGLVVVETS